jgi:hypothetical protein
MELLYKLCVGPPTGPSSHERTLRTPVLLRRARGAAQPPWPGDATAFPPTSHRISHLPSAPLTERELSPAGLLRTLQRDPPRARAGVAGGKDAKLGQKLGQLQPFIDALKYRNDCLGQLAYFGPTF